MPVTLLDRDAEALARFEARDALPTVVADLTEADWDFRVSVNQKAVYFLTRNVAQHMKGQGAAPSSSSPRPPASPAGWQATVYGSTKAAVLATMHGFARIDAPHGVRVNAVVPGLMDTPMLWVGQQPEAPGSTADPPERATSAHRH